MPITAYDQEAVQALAKIGEKEELFADLRIKLDTIWVIAPLLGVSD